MEKTHAEVTPRYASLKDSARITGLAESFLRSLCKSGDAPHIMSGRKYMIDLPALYRRLDDMSKGTGEWTNGV